MKMISKFFDLVAYRAFELQLYVEMYFRRAKKFFSGKK